MSTKNINEISKKQKIEERISFFMNNIRSSKSKNINKTNYTFETQENNHNTNEIYPKTEQNLKNSIPIKKEIGKMVESRFKIMNFEKLLPKFYKSIDISSSIASKISNHEITNSEIKMFEIDEKLPQNKLDQIESKRYNNNN